MFLYAALAMNAARHREEMDRKVHLRLDRDDPSITIQLVQEKIAEIQREHPDRDVFFDGDEYAICSQPRDVSE
jgi:hypothetical protein